MSLDTAPAPPQRLLHGCRLLPRIPQKHAGILLDRIRHQNDFPAMAESIATINRIASSEEESIASLSNLIIKDFALTNKLLRLVNSASFAHYGGGNISTVSRAVAILGFDAVKNVALTLLLFDCLKPQQARTSRMSSSILFSVLARWCPGWRGIEGIHLCDVPNLAAAGSLFREEGRTA
jgi:hypothetical protein